MTSLSASFPERALLLLCVRPRADQAAQRIRALAGSDLNWEYLQALAVEHGVVPLLSLRLHDVAGDVVPAEALHRLHELSKSSIFLNLSFAAELFRVLEVFRAAGLPAVPYKCPALAAISSGKVPGQFLFTREGSRIILELHTERTLRYFPRRLNLEEMLQRLESVSMGGREVLTFSAEDALSLLCVHGSKHFWERLMWIADIAALVQRPRGMNWPRALAQASSFPGAVA